MTEDDFRFHLLGVLDRIATAIERTSPSDEPKPIPRKLDAGDLTQMSYGNRDRLERKWQAEDTLKRFEPPF